MFLATAVRSSRLVALGSILCAAAWAPAQTNAPHRWPRTIEHEKGTVVVYSPQLESIVGDKLTAVSAVSVKLKESPEPVFGAVWFACRINTDRATQDVSFSELTVPDAKFPGTSEDKIAKLKLFLEQNMPISDIRMPMASLVKQVELVQEKRNELARIENAPPEIVFVTKPTVQVFFDGEPKLKKVEGSGLLKVVNTPYFMVFDSASSSYYLKGSGLWYSAKDWKGPWIPFVKPPDEAIQLASADFTTTDTVMEPPKDTTAKPPQIMVTTGNTEIVETTGEPEYVPISGTKLMYVGNTDRDWFIDSGTENNYLLLAGRWYAAASTKGPWQYVAQGSLPEDFGKIPADSPKASVLTAVPGTAQASEAVASLQVPQTASIKRSEATFTPTFDGEPKFQPIEGTNLSYAVNSPQSIIKTADGRTYANEDAVWYDAAETTGSYAVSPSVPQEIYSIPPSSPVYNVTYSYVYDSTPDTVYVGYTPGYTGSYYYGGSVCYGTGYYYPGWYGNYYYGRPRTWSVGAYYNPITDNWGVRFGYRGPAGGGVVWAGSGGWVGWGAGWYGGWIAGGHWDRDIDIDIDHHWNNNLYDRSRNFSRNDFTFNQNNLNKVNALDSNRWKNRAGEIAAAGGIGAAAGIAGSKLADRRRADNRATRPGQAGAGTQNPLIAARDNRLQTRDAKGPDNLFADKDGNVFRQTDKGWEQRVGNRWQKANDRVPSTQPARPGADRGPGQIAQTRPGTLEQRPSVGQQPAIQQRPAAAQQRPAVSQQPAIQQRPAVSHQPQRGTYDLNRQAQARQQASQRTQSYQRQAASRPSTPSRSSYSPSRSSAPRSAPSRSSGGGRSGGGRSGGGRSGGRR